MNGKFIFSNKAKLCSLFFEAITIIISKYNMIISLPPISLCTSICPHDKTKINIFKWTIIVIKESYSRVNESKQQLNSFIIYILDSIARVNERKKKGKKSEINKKKKSGAAGTRTHGRGSVPLVSKLDAIPLRHEAETILAAQISD